jgi:hypothetical protein
VVVVEVDLGVVAERLLAQLAQVGLGSPRCRPALQRQAVLVLEERDPLGVRVPLVVALAVRCLLSAVVPGGLN